MVISHRKFRIFVFLIILIRRHHMLFPPGVNFTAAVRVWCRETLSNQRGNDRRVAQHMVTFSQNQLYIISRTSINIKFLNNKNVCFWSTVVVFVTCSWDISIIDAPHQKHQVASHSKHIFFKKIQAIIRGWLLLMSKNILLN